MTSELQQRLRTLPRVDAVMAEPAMAALFAEHGRERISSIVREILDGKRAEILGGSPVDVPTPSDVASLAEIQLRDAATRSSITRVLNATGIIIHTNLGRAPLSGAARMALSSIASGYSNIEFDLAAGERGSRQAHVEPLLKRLTGAEAAVVVNNNAAAVMLAVNTVAREREVVTSRGELIEIGGSFRIPDVIETSEARLVETGTTNRTRVADFARAITPKSRMLLRVHPSNYRVVGFTESPSREEVVNLARQRGLVAMEDLGSGTLVDLAAYGLPEEPTVQDALRAGMDLVSFSGDKLLGGPQAGLVVGRADLIAQMKRNPLYRALRVDKLTIAALDATLRAYLDIEKVPERLPVLRMLAARPAELRKRAMALLKRLKTQPGLHAGAIEVESFAGGGSLPEQALPDWAVALRSDPHSADELHRRLRTGVPALVGRIQSGAVLLHMRTLLLEDLRDVATAVARAVS